MKKLLLLAALLPALAFAQASPQQLNQGVQDSAHEYAAMQQESLKSEVWKDSAPNSGFFPASCMSGMANLQLAQMLQVYAGNPMGDKLVDFKITQGVGSPSDQGYACLVVATWRDHGVQHGMAGIYKGPGKSVIYQWRPAGY